MSEELVSIVIPTFNCAEYLRRALQSVLNQTYKNWEALVIDNHSLDNTDDVVRNLNDGRIKLLKAHNKGVIAISRNLGIREASGRWVAFLDADDYWKPSKLAISVHALTKGADFVYHDLLRAGPFLQNLFSRRTIRSRRLLNPIHENLFKFGNAILNSSVVVRRDLLVNVGGISENPRLVAAEDFECWIRVSRLTDRFHRISGAHGFYWIGNANTSSSGRTIVCLSELRELYSKTCGSEVELYSPPWLSFALAKAYFEVNDFSACQFELRRLLASKQISRGVQIKANLLAILLLGAKIMQSKTKID